jgi:MYXO-CTERM domain-containing protein
MTWITPVAWIGLVSLGVPIVIHLLWRHENRRVTFPSLRFLTPTQSSALSRRRIEDWLLLALRMLILAAAVAALAGPVVHWPGREAAWASRVSRAVIFEAGIGNQVSVLPESYRAESFAREDARAAVHEALRWLDARPPSAREIVLSGRFRRGWISAADLEIVPPWVGIRVMPRDEPSPREQRLLFVERRDGELYRVMRSIGLSDEATGIREVSVQRIDAPPIVVTAAEAEREAAAAALDAILTRGVRWPDSGQAVTVAWPGSAGALAEAIDLAVETALDTLEPARVPADTIAGWAREPGPPPSSARPADEGDRRWFWALALLLLAAEWWMRRRRRAGKTAHASREARVA